MSRILLKLSGEALAGKDENSLYDQNVLRDIAQSIHTLKDSGNEIMLVIGGGNLFRGGALAAQLGVARATADYIGMLATIQNALVMRDYFNAHGIETRVASAIAMPQVCESYVPLRISRHLEKGRIVIFAAGLGAPFFTTDTTAVQRALELSAKDVVYVKNGVDGLYTGDPRKDPTAIRIPQISATEVVERNLRGLDLSAVALARDNGLTLRVIGMGDLARAMETGVSSIITPN